MDEFEAVERWEHHVRAFVGLDQHAAETRKAAAGEGPLSGWSVGVKDIIDVEGLPTRCNAWFLPPAAATENAEVVNLFEQAGAYVIGKTVTTTFAFLDPGETRNPWNTGHTPGGSSSGSAAAVATGMARVAIGTQTVGSVNRPASYCGVVGFKPTYDTLAMDGVYPFSPSVDTLGLFTRNVTDMQIVFQALTGEILKRQDPLRIGVVTDFHVDPHDAEMEHALDHVRRVLIQDHHSVFDIELPDDSEAAHRNHMALIASEAVGSHRHLVREHGDNYPERFKELLEQGSTVTVGDVENIVLHRERVRRGMHNLFGKVDMILSPGAPGAAPAGLDRTGDPRMNLMWTYTGLPTMTLPVMLNDAGLPLGVQFTGRRGNDVEFLAQVRMLERLIGFDAVPNPP